MALIVTLALLSLCPDARAQACNGINTGFDKAAGGVLPAAVPDTAYTVDAEDGSLGVQQAVAVGEDNYPTLLWYPNNPRSRWIGVAVLDSDTKPIAYVFDA